MSGQTQLDALVDVIERVRRDNVNAVDAAAEYLRMLEGGTVHRVEPQLRRRHAQELRDQGAGVREIMTALGVRKRRALQIAGGR